MWTSLLLKGFPTPRDSPLGLCEICKTELKQKVEDWEPEIPTNSNMERFILYGSDTGKLLFLTSSMWDKLCLDLNICLSFFLALTLLAHQDTES